MLMIFPPEALARPDCEAVLSALHEILLTPKEAGRHLRLSEQSLRQLRYNKRGPAYFKYANGEIRYRASEVIRFQLASEHQPSITLSRIDRALSRFPNMPDDLRAGLLQHLETELASEMPRGPRLGSKRKSGRGKRV